MSALRVYESVDQRSDEWYDQRRGMVTASVVGQLLTPTLKVASNDTSRGLTRLLAAERITGHTEPTWTNADMARGIEHEPIARDKYAEHNRVEVEQVGFMVRGFDDGSELGASPDGLVGDDGGIEIKCPRAKEHIRTILADEVPAQYMPQIQACLLVSDREWWDYVSCVGGMPLWIKRVTPDPAMQAAIIEAVAAFEKAVESMVSDYYGAVAGLPMTERIEMEMSL